MNGMGERYKFILLIGLVLTFVAGLFFVYFQEEDRDSIMAKAYIHSFAYLQDKNGQFTLEEVASEEMKDKF
jgi:hypothetical protein